MKKPNAVALFTKPGCDSDFSYTQKAVKVLSQYGITVLLPESIRTDFSQKKPSFIAFLPGEQEMIAHADMVLVLGGDGTMIDYCVSAAVKDKPTAGVNLGTLGFLTALERNEINGLSAIGTGDFTVENRMLLDVEIEDENGDIVHRQHILNDIVIKSGLHAKIGEFSMLSQNGKLLDYRSDGIIIATPTGSTAYSFSAGGPVIDPTAELIEVTPLCPHTLLRGSVLLTPDTILSVQGRTRDEYTDIHITMDGKNSQTLSENAKIHIKRSAYTAKIVKIGQNRFYDILETKLNRK